MRIEYMRRIEHMRREALLWSVVERYEEVTDRLLNIEVELPEVSGDFYITVNGIPACVADPALVGHFYQDSGCEHSSLHHCIRHRSRLKAAFSGAIVAVVAGSRPTVCSFLKAA